MSENGLSPAFLSATERLITYKLGRCKDLGAAPTTDPASASKEPAQTGRAVPWGSEGRTHDFPVGASSYICASIASTNGACRFPPAGSVLAASVSPRWRGLLLLLQGCGMTAQFTGVLVGRPITCPPGDLLAPKDGPTDRVCAGDGTPGCGSSGSLQARRIDGISEERT